MQTGYVVLGPSYEYNDSNYDVVGDSNLLTQNVFLNREAAEQACKNLWQDALTNKSNFYECYSKWQKKDIPNINRELFSINSKIYLHSDLEYDIPIKISDLEFEILKKYWSGPNIAYVKEVPIG